MQRAQGAVAAVWDGLDDTVFVGLPLNAEHVACPLPGLVGLLGDEAALLHVVEEQARHLHVMHENVGRVLDAQCLLALRLAHGEVAVGHEGVAAANGELLDDAHIGAGRGGLVGGG